MSAASFLFWVSQAAEIVEGVISMLDDDDEFVPESERIRRELRKRMRFARHCEEDSLKYAKRAAECEARGRHAKKDSDKRKYLRRHDIAEGKRKASDLAMARAYAIAVGMGRGAVPGIPELAPPPEYVFY